MLALLEPAGVVEDPGPDLRDLRHRRECVARGGEPHLVVVPGRVGDEAVQTLVRGVGLGDVDAVAHGDRLDGLALVADQPERVARKVLAPRVVAEHGADLVEEVSQPLLGGAIDLDVHGRDQITIDADAATSRSRSRATDRNDPTLQISSETTGARHSGVSRERVNVERSAKRKKAAANPDVRVVCPLSSRDESRDITAGRKPRQS